ncbi:hypothetical protein [Paenibacillus arenilitoris]|uniref:Uncharacterized protein n=1 Tax=Paenibacillus arenilitoris TaxID=2772299 RepID=A0A927CLK8_9BACL|nr:hypothetical protein [Paenibacillus arenilitoris]MBD2868106.1 hypothetical protein [Paenibacillus arenilitoris]
MKKKKLLLSVLLLVPVLLCLPFLLGYIEYRGDRVDDANAEPFVRSLTEAVERQNTISMADIASFEWDTMYMFPPYYPRDEMEKEVGRKWTPNQSYLGHLLHRSSFGEYPLSDDSLHKLVFVHNGEVVLDITLDRMSADFTSARRVTERSDSEFAVSRDEPYPVLRNASNGK